MGPARRLSGPAADRAERLGYGHAEPAHPAVPPSAARRMGESGEDLHDLIVHVLVHEVGHHFGYSDDDMEAIDEGKDGD